MKVVLTVICVMTMSVLLNNKGHAVRTETTAIENSTVFATNTESSSLTRTQCMLKNLTVIPVYNKTFDYINLQISWKPINKNYNLTLRLYPDTPNENNCVYYTDIFNHPLRNNKITVPDELTEFGIAPSCTYKLSITVLKPIKEQCVYTYAVPECVEKKCNCDKLEPRSRILNVDDLSEKRFLVRWDPGDKTINNRSYTVEDVYFTYTRKSDNNNDIVPVSYNLAKKLKNDITHHTAEVIMDLSDGLDYTLFAYVKNNFSCRSSPYFHFTAPTRTNVNYGLIIMVIVVGLAVILMTVKYKSIINLFPRNTTNHHLGQENTRLCKGQEQLKSNLCYNPIKSLEGHVHEFELDRDRIEIKEIVGSAATGFVYSAHVKGIAGIKDNTTVAVKVLGEKGHTTKEDMKDFLTELDVLKKVGRHTNIVALLGCCTLQAPYMLLKEFVSGGDLKNYLLELQEQWSTEKSSQKSKEAFFAEVRPITANGPASDTPLSIDEFLNFALQIARGMAHLEQNRIVHRTLAAQNILINEDKTLKISGFGQSSNDSDCTRNFKKIPIRWMAIESILDQKFDNKSDVWSFGIVLWEIGTLGAFPYESIPDSFLHKFLQMGKRLEPPEICSEDLYVMMQQCWASNPNDRPAFHELVDKLEERSTVPMHT